MQVSSSGNLIYCIVRCFHSMKAMLACKMRSPTGGIAFAPLKPCWVAEILLRISDYIECVIHALACALTSLRAVDAGVQNTSSGILLLEIHRDARCMCVRTLARCARKEFSVRARNAKAQPTGGRLGSGRGGGIRTHDTLRYAGFQDRCIRPLCHPSVIAKLIAVARNFP